MSRTIEALSFLFLRSLTPLLTLKRNGDEAQILQLHSTDYRHSLVNLEDRCHSMHTNIALRWILILLLSSGVARARRDNCSALPASLYPPIDRAGPPLTVPQVKLSRAVKCYRHVNTTRQQAETYRWILLIPGTSEHVEELFDWNWIPVLHAYRWPYCTLQLPRRGMCDLQLAAEYVVYALRYMSKLVEQERQGRETNECVNVLFTRIGGD